MEEVSIVIMKRFRSNWLEKNMRSPNCIVCLDYPLHVFSNTCTKVSARNAVKKILKPLRIGVLTSIFAYMGHEFERKQAE
jgi:hypothetical protein